MDDTVPFRLAVVIGSVREGRFGPVVARWFAERARRRPEFRVDLVDLAVTGTAGGAGSALAPHIDAADAVVVVTPEYNHSFPGPLKTAIDSTGAEWKAKPVVFVAYGGVSGGLRAVEALRPVFAELRATTLRDTVSFHGASACFDEAGEPREADADAAATVVLDDLAWWAGVLRSGRGPRSATAA